MSRYGYEASYANRWDVGSYEDEITGNRVSNPEKRNPVTGPIRTLAHLGIWSVHCHCSGEFWYVGATQRRFGIVRQVQ